MLISQLKQFLLCQVLFQERSHHKMSIEYIWDLIPELLCLLFVWADPQWEEFEVATIIAYHYCTWYVGANLYWRKVVGEEYCPSVIWYRKFFPRAYGTNIFYSPFRNNLRYYKFWVKRLFLLLLFHYIHLIRISRLTYILHSIRQYLVNCKANQNYYREVKTWNYK